METYTEEDERIYEETLQSRLNHIGYTPKDHELYMMKIGCKQEVSKRKGETYELTNDEIEEMKRIWETYGKPFI
jgi:hypothetical protein